MTKLFEHDCTSGACCEYIGSTNKADIYAFGLKREEGPSLIIRLSDEPSDYLCGPLSWYRKLDDPQHISAVRLYDEFTASS